MSFSIIYKKLCDVNLYHEYFLNDGVTSFDDSPTLKEQQLSKYDFREFMGVMPSEDTHTLLNGYRIIFKPTEKGFTLLIQVEEVMPNSGNFTPKVTLEPDTKLEFLLYINDFIFENYSTVSAIPHKPFYFSNKKPIYKSGYKSVVAKKSGVNKFLRFIVSRLDKKGFLQPDHKRKSMIRNISNIFHRINLSEQEIRILLGIFSTLNEFNKKS